MPLRAVQHVLVPPGRRVAVHRTATRAGWLATAGIVDGDGERVIVFCHGAPGAGIFDPDPVLTTGQDVTLLAVDRPGYGGSDAVPAGEWATVAGAADDIAAVLDRFRIDRVGAVGWSAGGRVALALAARRPDLVDRVAVLATPAPDEDVPWLPEVQREFLDELRGGAPDEAHAALDETLARLIPDDPLSDEALALLAAGPPDASALRAPGTRARLGEMLRVAFMQGATGLAADIAGYCMQPWGFELGDVEAKTLLLYGSEDPVAGPRHGRWWLGQLPSARLEVSPGAGHLLVVPMWRRVLSHLAPGRGRGTTNVRPLVARTPSADLDHLPAA
jgi:pimeloyl-ACP methyl ester carboxylesterase